MKEQDFNLSRGLDFYKPTMTQFEFERHPDAEVTFTFKNRGNEQLSSYVSAEQLRERFEGIIRQGWTPEEVAYLASLQAQDGTARFTPEYLDHIANMQLPPIDIGYDQEGDISIETTGTWSDVSFWETVVMSELNELYYQGLLAREGLSLEDLYSEGDKRLSEKIAVLQSRPDIQIVDFGTRRRFSAGWHRHVVERLATECPKNIIGTSNVWFAHEFGLKPVGTFAHELPMVYAALEDLQGGNPLDGHDRMLIEWYERYGQDLAMMLPDTYRAKRCIGALSKEQLLNWRGFRHDSGDPTAFGFYVLNTYHDNGLNSNDKNVMFSDGLNLNTIVELTDTFGSFINTTHGWGTGLTNDLGVKPTNQVMKATHVRTPSHPNGAFTVKLSDVKGKHTGPIDVVKRYDRIVQEDLAHQAMAAMAMV